MASNELSRIEWNTVQGPQKIRMEDVTAPKKDKSTNLISSQCFSGHLMVNSESKQALWDLWVQSKCILIEANFHRDCKHFSRFPHYNKLQSWGTFWGRWTLFWRVSGRPPGDPAQALATRRRRAGGARGAGGGRILICWPTILVWAPELRHQERVSGGPFCGSLCIFMCCVLRI